MKPRYRLMSLLVVAGCSSATNTDPAVPAAGAGGAAVLAAPSAMPAAQQNSSRAQAADPSGSPAALNNAAAGHAGLAGDATASGSGGSAQPAATAQVDAAVPANPPSQDAKYETLLAGEWSLEPGAESTRTCIKRMLTEDIYVSAIRPINPPGTHHSLLAMGDAASECTESVVDGLIYAAAAGTNGLRLPPGVAIKLPAGKVLNLGLHVFNTSDSVLTGRSGIEVTTMPVSEVEHESQAVLVGPAPFALAPKTNQVLKSTCTLTGAQHVYAVFPHMHEYGRHMKTTAVIGGKQAIVHDGDFEFAEQRQIPLSPMLSFNANDTITTECTYQNSSDTWVLFGESTTTEMCVSVLFAYPPVGTGLCLGPAE